jgi:hypothetical protein
MASPFYHPPLRHVPGVPQVADAQLGRGRGKQATTTFLEN